MSEHIAETWVKSGLRVKLIADADAAAPNEWRDDALFIVTTHNRYFELRHNGMNAAECEDDKDLARDYHVFRLNAYIHGGVALSLSNSGQFSDPWDSGQIGFVYVSKSEWRYRERTIKKCVSARKAADGYVETWNQYLSGDVWGYVIETETERETETDDTDGAGDGAGDGDGELVDSCWGFYGLDYARAEATSALNTEIESKRKREERERTDNEQCARLMTC